MKKIPRHSELELEIILESSVQIPERISDSVYKNKLRDNPKLKWGINPLLANKNKLLLLLKPADVKKWLFLKRLNWLTACMILLISLLNNDIRLLWALPIFPILMNSGILSHWIMLFNIALLFALSNLFGFNSHFLWYITAIVMITYLLSKLTYEFLEKVILKIAFGDPDTFWKYYSNQLIIVDGTKINNEYQNLLLEYPELVIKDPAE